MHVIMSRGIDPMSGEPAHRQLAAIIRSKIESGEYPPGAPLPSAKSMAQEYGISVGAVTRAVDVATPACMALHARCQAVASGCSHAPRFLSGGHGGRAELASDCVEMPPHSSRESPRDYILNHD